MVLVLALLLPGVIKAQEFNVTAKADFVSDYIWRGAYQNSGFSVQPTLGLSYGNLSLSARSEERRVGKECRSRWSPYH